MLKYIMSLGMIVMSAISIVTAQADCPTLASLESTIAATRNLCADAGTGQACAGTVGVRLDDTTLAEGASLALADTSRLTLENDSEALPMALLQLDGGDGTISAVLYGAATLENRSVAPPDETITLTARNTAGYDVNLRAGAGTTFAEVGTLAADADVVLDGRSADSQWVRVQADNGPSWVKASLLRIEGSLSTLSTVGSPYTLPYQAALLTTADVAESDCEGVRGGLLLQATDTTTRLNINDADIAFDSATLLVQVAADDTLTVQVLTGEATVTAAGSSATLADGEAAVVSLDSETALAVSAPQSQATYVFANVAYAPLELLPVQTDDLCVTGVPLAVDERETRGGPGAAYSAFAPLDNQSHYDVEGYATDDTGQVWFRLANGRWTPALNNDLVGACAGYVEVDAPPVGQQASSVQNQNISLVPTQNVRYQAYSGPDVMTGQCSSAPIAVCDHLAVVVVNADGSLGWRGQEPVTYPLSAAGQNRFVFNGRNFQNNASLALDLTFTTSGWTMTMTTIFDSDPTCTHTFYYTGAVLN